MMNAEKSTKKNKIKITNNRTIEKSCITTDNFCEDGS